ncbi:nucleotidyltransferase domain-containing protein [Hyalangium versicolor]|uniref:nucleotidyltransferase domain-containing protein n=1 Tax=Hyalangium versicolor TaxID=2861190 RepID=UPI001CCE860A|nr:nucleotidyltransferase [Hyalangium versicolor]
MWSVREAVQRFIESLELTDHQREEVIRQHTLVREQLRRWLSPKTDFLSGSYARRTAIRPLHDIDLFVVLRDTSSPPSESQDTVLKQIRQALQPLRPGMELPILQEHSVHIGFSSPGIEFDVVPAFQQPSQQFYFIPERGTAQWIRSNPRLHEELSTAANERAGKKLKPLLKAVKHWNRNHGSSPLRSFHLEAMSYSAFTSPPTGYLEGLEALFSHLSQQVQRSCPDPAGLGPNVDKYLLPNDRNAAQSILGSAAREMRLVLTEERSYPSQAHARLRSLFGPEYRDGP